MNRVRKRPRPPAVLARRGPKATRALEALQDAHVRAGSQGAATFCFEAGIYGAPSVKRALREDQFDKCCYCESKLAHVAHGDAEHYRPKAGWQQQANGPVAQPGYYWLAYSWENLFFSCEVCNQSYKGSLFPLVDAAARVRDHHGDLRQEQPLLLRPDEDPEPHLAWSAADVVGRTDRGRASVEAYGLNRPELWERRKSHLDQLHLLARGLRELSQDGRDVDLVAALRDHLEAACRDDAEFTAMARAMLR